MANIAPAAGADDLTLFDATPYVVPPVAPEPVEKLSADRRRTARQATAVRNGIHPLALVFGQYAVQMHPDADRGATAADPANLPLRCGSCAHRVVVDANARRVPKCWWRDTNPTDRDRHAGGPEFATHSAATDTRAWWPACRRYTPGDTAVSDDAARYIPDYAGATP